MVTVPKSFNVDAGVKLRPRLTSKGIFYEFVDGNAFLDFDEEILNDLVTHENQQSVIYPLQWIN